MTRALVAIVGLLVGVFLGGALLLLNPLRLTQGTPAPLSGAIQTLGWETGDAFRGLPLTLRGLLGVGAGREDALTFQEAGIQNARVEVVLMNSENGAPPALGVKLSALARNNSLVEARLGTTTAWNVAWPGRGTLLLAGSENFWSPLRDGLWATVRGRGFRPAGPRYSLPPLPGLGAPAIAGGSGEFAGVSGAFREEFAPAEAEPGGFGGLRQLHLAIE